MSNSVFQSVIVQLRDITDRSFGVIDTEGCVVSCTDMSILGERWTDAALKVSGAADSIVTFGQRSFKAILGNSNVLEYAVFCSGDDETARSFCQMAYIALNDAKTFYEEKHDRGTFVKNIIMDNILPGDIYIRAKELHFATDAPRAVFLIRQVGHRRCCHRGCAGGACSRTSMQDFVLSINETRHGGHQASCTGGTDPRGAGTRSPSPMEDTLNTELSDQDRHRHRHRVRPSAGAGGLLQGSPDCH